MLGFSPPDPPPKLKKMTKQEALKKLEGNPWAGPTRFIIENIYKDDEEVMPELLNEAFVGKPEPKTQTFYCGPQMAEEIRKVMDDYIKK
jgi:hypothetical protein